MRPHAPRFRRRATLENEPVRQDTQQFGGRLRRGVEGRRHSCPDQPVVLEGPTPLEPHPPGGIPAKTVDRHCIQQLVGKQHPAQAAVGGLPDVAGPADPALKAAKAPSCHVRLRAEGSTIQYSKRENSLGRWCWSQDRISRARSARWAPASTRCRGPGRAGGEGGASSHAANCAASNCPNNGPTLTLV